MSPAPVKLSVQRQEAAALARLSPFMQAPFMDSRNLYTYRSISLHEVSPGGKRKLKTVLHWYCGILRGACVWVPRPLPPSLLLLLTQGPLPFCPSSSSSSSFSLFFLLPFVVIYLFTYLVIIFQSKFPLPALFLFTPPPHTHTLSTPPLFLLRAESRGYLWLHCLLWGPIPSTQLPHPGFIEKGSA